MEVWGEYHDDERNRLQVCQCLMIMTLPALYPLKKVRYIRRSLRFPLKSTKRLRYERHRSAVVNIRDRMTFGKPIEMERINLPRLVTSRFCRARAKNN